jgi:hypothetical protein
VAQAIKANLLKDASVDGLITISAPDANSAANAISQRSTGRKGLRRSFSTLRSSTYMLCFEGNASPFCTLTRSSRGRGNQTAYQVLNPHLGVNRRTAVTQSKLEGTSSHGADRPHKHTACDIDR